MIEMKMILHDPEELRFAAEFCTKLADRRAKHDAVVGGLFDVRDAVPHETASEPEQGEMDDEPRAYGEASAGRKRRTKEEMAEDAEIEALAEKLKIASIPTDEPAQTVLASFRGAANALVATPTPAPESEPLTGEIVNDEPTGPSRDDLMAAMRDVVVKHSQVEGAALIGKVFAPYGKTKQSEFDDDPVVFAELIAKLKEQM